MFTCVLTQRRVVFSTRGVGGCSAEGGSRPGWWDVLGRRRWRHALGSRFLSEHKENQKKKRWEDVGEDHLSWKNWGGEVSLTP